MNIRMIGFDLDGTLLTTDKILTERTKKALEAAADQGVVLVPATGRPLCGLPKELLALPFIKYAVTANGARILETKTEQVLSEMLISVEKAREILDIFSDYDTLRWNRLLREREACPYSGLCHDKGHGRIYS